MLLDGEPAAFLERGGRSLRTLPAFERPGAAEAALRALAGLVSEGRLRSLQLARIDGGDAALSPYGDALAAAGFRRGYRGWQVAGALRRPGSGWDDTTAAPGAR